MFGQGDFSAGLWRGKKAPQSAFYDCSNGLIDDEGNLARRGASAYKSNANAGDTLVGLFDGYLAGGLRTLMWAKSPASGSLVYRLGSDDATPGGLTTTTLAIDPLARGAVANGVLFLPSSGSGGSTFKWAGSRKTSDNLAGFSGTFTQNSPVVGGAWTAADYEAGAIVGVVVGDSTYYLPVKSVDSSTQVTLTTPWPLASGTHVATISNFLNTAWSYSDVVPAPRLATATGTSARVWTVHGDNRAYYSAPLPAGPGTYTNNYIDLPAASYITGLDSFSDTLVLFTTEGVWTIANTDLDPIDDAGNLQWQQQEITRDVILWADPGIAGWEGSLLVPAVDDVYVLSLDGSAKSISEGIRPIYRSYVAAGYQPGLARVHRGHYFLPIVNGTTWVDEFVCRVDRPTQTPSGRVIYPWTRWTGHAASIAYAQRIGSTTRTPKLLGLAGQRVTDLTATLDGQGATDADTNNVAFTWTTNDIPLANGTATKLRGRYELVSASTPTVTVEYSSDQDAGAFTALTVKGEQGGATGWGKSDGSRYQWANVTKRRDRIRFRFTLSGAATSLVWRAVELLTRATGKQ
jgi:hypothetical protein